jgi:ferredoxin-type protein NapF
MSTNAAKRALFAKFRGGPPQWRPPWSIEEEGFTDRCTQCGECIEVCPTRLIARGHAGYPIVDFSNADCTFCGACRDVCEESCFDPAADPPWTLKAFVKTACVETKGIACRMCQDRCEASAIRFRPMVGGRTLPDIIPDECTGCGACVATCPVSAIAISHHMPDTAEIVS